MKYTCMIVDDEELARELIETHLSQLDDFELVASCGSAIEASKVLQQEAIDLLFLDIEMPVLKGTEFFKNLLNKPRVIFTTAYRDYAVEGFELNAVDYLLKPIVFHRFFQAIEKFRALQTTTLTKVRATAPETGSQKSIFIRKNRKQCKLILAEIAYVESVKDYVKIVTDTEVHVVKYGISEFEKKLDHRFVRIHRSYIVNKNRITAYTKNDLELGEKEIPIGEVFKGNMERLFNDSAT